MKHWQIERQIVDCLEAKVASVIADTQMDEKVIADAIAAYNSIQAAKPVNILTMFLTHPVIKPAIAACIVITVAAIAVIIALRQPERPGTQIVSKPVETRATIEPNRIVEQQTEYTKDQIQTELNRIVVLCQAGDINDVVAAVAKADPRIQEATANYLADLGDQKATNLLIILSDRLGGGEPNNVFETALKKRQKQPDRQNPAPGVKESKVETGPAKQGPAGPNQITMLTVTVKVVDEQDNPVAGAVIKPYGLIPKNGRGHYAWTKKYHGEPVPVSTNANGLAELNYPMYVEEKLPTGAISFQCRHPEFVSALLVSYPVDGLQEPVVLQKGALLKVRGYIGSRNNTVSDICVLFNNDMLTWLDANMWSKTSDGFIQTKQCPAGPHYLRIVCLQQAGQVYFSDIISFEAVKNKLQEFTLELKPGIRVEGRLDDSVPRPVANGRVVTIVTPAGPKRDDEYLNPPLKWFTNRPVSADGSFIFESLPAGQMQVTGICDGFVSKSPLPPEPNSFFGPGEARPQAFLLSEPAAKVELLMERTACCEVTVVNEQGQPIKDANVAFWPNIRWGDHTAQVFPGYSSKCEDLLQGQAATLPHMSTGNYMAITNAAGIALVGNVPGFYQRFGVTHSDYEMPLNSFRIRTADVYLFAGQTTKVRVIMQKKGTDVLGDKEEDIKPSQTLPRQLSTLRPEDEPSDYVGTVVEGQTLSDEFSGFVVDENNNPIEKVLVDAWSWYPGNETYTDANGFFRLAGLEKGVAIEVRFSKEGYSPRLIVRQPLGVKDAVVVLDSNTYFEGTVTDAKGKSVAGARIRASQGPKQAQGVMINSIWTETTTDNDGKYRLYVHPDKYDIQVKAPQGVARYEGIIIAKGRAKTLNIILNPALTFRAKVIDIDTNEPVADIRLWHWQHKDINAASDKDGWIEIPMLPGKFEFDIDGGEYTRWWSQECISEWGRFKIDSDKNGWQRNFDGLDFDIQPEMEPVTIYVERGVHIRGKVLDPQGNIVAGATVAPARTGTGNSLTGDTRFSVETKQDGTFDMLLPASKGCEYNIVAHDGKYRQWRKWANGVAEPIRTKPGEQIDNVILRLTVPATVRGSVVDKSGKPVANREVHASALDKMENRYYDSTTETDANGHFELKFIRPGQHYIQVAPFWLDAAQAPQGTNQIVELDPGDVLEGIDLVAEEKRTF